VDIETFFQCWHDGLIGYDRSLTIVAMNEAAERLTGVEASHAVGRPLSISLGRYATELEALMEASFETGRSSRVLDSADFDSLVAVASARGDDGLLVMYRASDRASVERDAGLRNLDLANQLLTFHTEHSPLAVIRWDADFHVVGWSARAETMFGWRADEVQRRTFAEIGMVYEPDMPQVLATVRELRAGTASTVCENRNVTKSVRVINCRWFNSRVPLPDGSFGVLSLVEDNTENVLARRAASESEQRFRSIFDYSPEPILSLAIDGTITRANAAAAQAHGVSAEGMIGASVLDFIVPADLTRSREALRRATHGRAGSIEVSVFRGDDAYPIAASFVPIVLDGRVSGVHLLTRDISAIRRAEREIKLHAEHIRELYLASATNNATAEDQIAATIEAGCRLLHMRSGALYDSQTQNLVAIQGPPIPQRIAQLSTATTGALALDDIDGLPFIGEVQPGEPAVVSFIGTPISVNGAAYGSLCFADPAPRAEPFRDVDRDLIQLMGELVGSAIDRSRAREHLKLLAYNDQLTGLPNRASFVTKLNGEIARAVETGTNVAVMFLDLDRFKDINDSLGHALGDQLLRIVGDRLAATVAQAGFVARMGGDEFIVLVVENTATDALANLAERIIACIDQPFEIDGYEQFVTTSVGISVFPNDGGDADTLVKHADIAMYRAKDRGRNTYQFFTLALNASLRSRLSQEKSLRRALENGEFVIHYQPQIELAGGRLVGVEALVRWDHPRLGLLAPDQFVPTAEISGQIVALGDWVLDTAARQLAAWQAAGHPDLRLSVNLSARQFHQTQLAISIRRTLDRYDLEPRTLELEITESVAMSDARASALILREVSDIGVGLSLDDFGTGYSSLGYLRSFPLDSIKIDKSFVNDIMTEPDDATIVRTVIAMAHSLALEVIAEGVETDDQLAFLRRERCDRVQGYLFSRPIPAADLTALLERYEPVIV
jgi:diguanylate cyclase (GGDEF)-like protein/PAS domain S-box-containing protein